MTESVVSRNDLFADVVKVCRASSTIVARFHLVKRCH